LTFLCNFARQFSLKFADAKSGKSVDQFCN